VFGVFWGGRRCVCLNRLGGNVHLLPKRLDSLNQRAETMPGSQAESFFQQECSGLRLPSILPTCPAWWARVVANPFGFPSWRLVLDHSWDRLTKDQDLPRSGFLGLGLLCKAFSPLLAT
jgi:hypothetical protein